MNDKNHVWVMHGKGCYDDIVFHGVFRTLKSADTYARESISNAKYNREEQTWYHDEDYDWLSVTKEEVQ